MKKPQEDLSNFFMSLARHDHSDLNAVYQAGGRRFTIPVRLEHEGKKVAEGTVQIMPVRARMESSAVYVFENVLNSYGMDLDWDRAVAGVSLADEDTTIIDPCHVSGHDEFVPLITRYDRNLNLNANMVKLREHYDARADDGYERPSDYKKGVDLAGLIIAHTAVVKSPDLEKFLFYKEAKFGSFFMGFRPRGLEF